MSEKMCPVCGSVKLVIREVPAHIQEQPYGSLESYTAVENICEACGESGDFFGVNESRIEEAMRRSNQASVPKMCEVLSERGISNAYIERVLRLPTRTVARWKRGDFSAAALALLKLIVTFPWLLDVADSDFKIEASETKITSVPFDTATSRVLFVSELRPVNNPTALCLMEWSEKRVSETSQCA